MRYKGSAAELRTIASELGVGRILEGSVRQSGDRIRITAKLVNPESGENLWAQDYDRELTDIFAIQSEVAERVATALEVELSPSDQARLERLPTRSLEAHEMYLRGRAAWNRRTGPDLLRALEFFTRATELDTGYAAAWAATAATEALLPSYTRVSDSYAYPRARAAAARALAADSTQAEAFVALAFVQGEYAPAAEVERMFLRAIELNPGYATGHQWYAVWLASVGRVEEAVAHMRLAHTLDPLSLIITAEVGWMYYYARDFDTAIEYYAKAVALDPDFAQAHEFLWGVYEQLGRYEEAADEAGIAIGLHGQPEAVGRELTASLRAAYEREGAAGYWRERLAWLGRLGRGTSYLSSQMYAASVYARAGDTDRALAELMAAVEESGGFRTYIAVEPALDPLRGDPRFGSVLAALAASIGKGTRTR